MLNNIMRENKGIVSKHDSLWSEGSTFVVAFVEAYLLGR